MRNVIEKIFPTITSKVVLAVSFAFVFGGGGFVFYALQTGQAFLQKQVQAKAHSVAELGKTIIEQLMLEGKHERVRTAIETAVSPHQATDIAILKSNGTIAWSARSDLNFKALPIDQFTQSPEYPGDRFFSAVIDGNSYEYVISSIAKKAECFKCHPQNEPDRGSIAVKVSSEDIRQAALQHRTTNIIMTALTFLGLGCVVFLSLLFLVIRPLKKLQTQMSKMEYQLDTIEDGEHMEFSKLNVSRSHDEIAGLITTINKFTKRLNEVHHKLHEVHQGQLEHAHRLSAVGEIAASITHEIKNPIVGVISALRIIHTELPDGHPHKEIIQEMMSHMERMSGTVNELLSYARPTSPVFEMANLNQVIERSLLFLKPQVHLNNVRISSTLDESNPHILADAKLLQQMLWNVLANAIQAMEDGGTLSVITARKNSNVRIQIGDTGKGMSREVQSKLFKPFFTTKYEGTGLGLAICKRIADQHNGTISLESTPGEGTTVTITLPISSAGESKQ